MKILFALTYYRPYVSGPIIYVENLARELVARGHEVTVLTSHYHHALEREEWLDRVRVVQVPQFEAPTLAALAWQMGKPATLTYHCDVQLPKGWFNRLVDRVVLVGNFVAAASVDRIIAYTEDYARHSPLMSRFLSKVEVI